MRTVLCMMSSLILSRHLMEPIYVRRLFSKCCDHSPLPANDFGLASRRVTVKPRSRMVVGESGEAPYVPLICVSVEPMTGIEPAYSAWEADVLPLNYIGLVVSEG